MVSKGPTLEDIALANISLDLFGQATAFTLCRGIDNKIQLMISPLKEMQISFRTILLLNLIIQTLALQLLETFS